jgi:hypothetical protein
MSFRFSKKEINKKMNGEKGFTQCGWIFYHQCYSSKNTLAYFQLKCRMSFRFSKKELTKKLNGEKGFTQMWLKVRTKSIMETFLSKLILTFFGKIYFQVSVLGKRKVKIYLHFSSLCRQKTWVCVCVCACVCVCEKEGERERCWRDTVKD